VLVAERPDAVLVLGDTNRCLAAIIAKRMHIPVFHMEAGNRCFDVNVPEETNRRIIDHTADFNLCYTEQARRNLLAEGLSPRQTFVTGSPMAEVITTYRDRIEASDVLSRLGLEAGGYYLVSMHREENIDDPARLNTLLTSIAELATEARVRAIVSTHPRLQRELANHAKSTVLEFLEPFGYLDYNKLQLNARCVLSDSGTVSEEAAIAGFPAVTIRDSMERPEAMETGTIVLTGVDADGIRRAVDLVVQDWQAGVRPTIPPEYAIDDCSLRVVRLITGLAGVHADWVGLRQRRGTSH
jgi:UDP-N-acetylglucosamine 2-epimerase (non-hydrolysing)